jgi:hypothetical protein
VGDVHSTIPVDRSKWFEYGMERSGRFTGLQNADGSSKTECGVFPILRHTCMAHTCMLQSLPAHSCHAAAASKALHNALPKGCTEIKLPDQGALSRQGSMLLMHMQASTQFQKRRPPQ